MPLTITEAQTDRYITTAVERYAAEQIKIPRGGFDAFWNDNKEALEAEGWTEGSALSAILHNELYIGGGAAPLFRVGLEEA